MMHAPGLGPLETQVDTKAGRVCHPSRTRPGPEARPRMNQNDYPVHTDTLDTSNPTDGPTEGQPEQGTTPGGDAAPAAGTLTSADGSVSPNQSPNEIFDSHETFETLGLRSSVLKGVEALGFKLPTSIQARLIPVVLTGRDVIGQAK